MTARELIFRLKEFPADAEVAVRGRNKHEDRLAVAVALLPAKREDGEPEGKPRKAVVRIIGAEG